MREIGIKNTNDAGVNNNRISIENNDPKAHFPVKYQHKNDSHAKNRSALGRSVFKMRETGVKKNKTGNSDALVIGR